jgi:hypothetical protein
MDYDKVLTYLVAVATVINLLTGSAKNIHDMRKDKKNKKRPSSSQPSTKRKKK